MQKKQSPLARLLGFAGAYKSLTFVGLILSAVAQVSAMVPYMCIWLIVRDLVNVAPDFSKAQDITRYGWTAFAFAVGGILVYFLALMFTHLAAFRTASNIRKQGMAHLMRSSFGFFDDNASGFLRNRLDNASAETETLLAHNLADIVGTAVMFVAMIVLMFAFDARMGTSCLFSVVISITMLCYMIENYSKINADFAGSAGRNGKGRNRIRARNSCRKSFPADSLFVQVIQRFN